MRRTSGVRAAVSLTSLFDCQTARVANAPPPLFLAARGQALLAFSPGRQARGVERRAAHPTNPRRQGVGLRGDGGAPRGAPLRRSPYDAGPRFSAPRRFPPRLSRATLTVAAASKASIRPRRFTVSELLAGGPIASGRSPGIARVQGYEPRPRAPPPPPPSLASHENALGIGRLSRDIVHKRNIVKRPRSFDLQLNLKLPRAGGDVTIVHIHYAGRCFDDVPAEAR